MKVIPFLFLLLFISPPEKDLQSIFQSYESTSKTVALHFQKKITCKKNKKNLKLTSSKYFRLMPPKYDIYFDTLSVFDTSKFTKEIAPFYKVVSSQILITKGGYKWVKEKQSINFCEQDQQFKDLSKNQRILKYQQESSEYILVHSLAVSSGGHHHNGEIDWEARKVRYKIAKEHIKAGKTKRIIQRKIAVSPGYLKELHLTDLENSNFKEEELLVLEAGQWKMLEAKRVNQKCEASLKNQQICLHRLGYDTSLDGETTLKYKIAKNLFRGENNLFKVGEEAYLQALGW